LDKLVIYAGLLVPNDQDARKALASFTGGLILRVINDDVVVPNEAANFWRWLEILRQNRLFNRQEEKQLEDLFDSRADLRRAIQDYALSVRGDEETIDQLEQSLQRSFVGFGGRPEDIVRQLARFNTADNQDQVLRREWCDLMRAGLSPEGILPAVRHAGRPFQGNDPDLAAFIVNLENPQKPDWQVEYEQRLAEHTSEERAVRESARSNHIKIRPDIQVGELGTIIDLTKTYLGHNTCVNNALPAEERIADFFGADLQEDAFVGFEAALQRSDLPTAGQIVDSLTRDGIWTPPET
jgi:hypothetical protein